MSRALRPMPLEARRVFRLGLTMALALAAAYALGAPLPYLAPVIALTLGATPAPPMGPKGLLGLILVVLITLGVGLLLIPMLQHYPFPAVLMVAAGLYISTYLSVNLGKGLVGTLLAVGFTMIPAAGTVDFALALMVIHALLIAVALAVVCQWIVYPWFAEERDMVPAPAPPATTTASNWIALRTAIIVVPPFLLALGNPASYMPLIMKSIVLGQQGSTVSARSAGRELLGSTFLGGSLAIAFWFALKLNPSLWMFFLWMLLFSIGFAGKLYRVANTQLPASFWQNACVTMLILVGPAVEDTANGKDVQEAFVTRMSLFVAVTLYAWGAVFALEQLRVRRAT
jgi:uncharacterized membrane protein YccC